MSSPPNPEEIPLIEIHSGEQSLDDSIHQTAKDGAILELQNKLLNLPSVADILQVHNGRTVLHYAAEYPIKQTATDMIKIILSCMAIRKNPEEERRLLGAKLVIDKDEQTNVARKGDTALHIAARNYNREGVIELLLRGGDVTIKNGKGEQSIDLIYENVPHAIIELFDKGLKVQEMEPCWSLDDEDWETYVDFGTVVGFYQKHATSFVTETEMLRPAVFSRRCCWSTDDKKNTKKIIEILLHPVVGIFLHKKWNAIKGYIRLSIGIHVIWSLLSSAFFASLYGWDCAYNVTIRKEDKTADCIPGISTLVLGALASFLSLVILLKEFYEMRATVPRWKYISKENIGQLTLIVCTWIAARLRPFTHISIDTENKGKPSVLQIAEWEYYMVAPSALVAFALILAQLGKLPKSGIYMKMLQKVSERSLYFMVAFGCLLTGFWVSFHILLPTRDEFKGFGFVKMLTLLIGEVNYDDIFFGQESDLHVPFPVTTQLVFLAAILTVTIVMASLLIAILVSDFMALRKEGHLSNIKTQLREINLMENFLLSLKCIMPKAWLQNIQILNRENVVDHQHEQSGDQNREIHIPEDANSLSSNSSQERRESRITIREDETDNIGDRSVEADSENLPSTSQCHQQAAGSSKPIAGISGRSLNTESDTKRNNENLINPRTLIKMNDASIPLELREGMRKRITKLIGKKSQG